MFEKTNKINKPFITIIKEREREREDLNQQKYKLKVSIITDTMESWRILEGYYKQLNANELNHLKEMGGGDLRSTQFIKLYLEKNRKPE